MLLPTLLVSGCGGSASQSDTSSTSEAPSSTSQPSNVDTPVLVGLPAEVGEWVVRISRIAPNADPEIVPLAPFNLPSPEGQRRFMVRVEAAYVGEISGRPANLEFALIGTTGVEFDAMTSPCGVIPSPLADVGEIFRGGSSAGNACWQIPAVDADKPVLRVESGESAVFLSADPNAGVVSGSVVPDGIARFEIEPVPFGDSTRVGDWELRVVNAQTSPGPSEDLKTVLVEMEATLVDGAVSMFWVGLDVDPIGSSLSVFEAGAYSCEPPGVSIEASGEISTGETVAGWLCWNLPISEVEGLALVIRDAAGETADLVFMAIE